MRSRPLARPRPLLPRLAALPACALALAGGLLVATERPSPAQERPARPPPPADAGWRLQDAAGAPPWLTFGLEHRARFEHLANDFRATSKGDATGLSLRTLASVEVRAGGFFAGAEGIDARVYASDETPLNTTLIDAVEPLRLYVGGRARGVAARGDALSVSAGRLTLDVGSRRLVARNDFRNTINQFTGLDLTWASGARQAAAHVVRVFAVMPVARRPTDAEALRDNSIETNRESTDAVLWGTFYASPPIASGASLEAYALGLIERDSADLPTANRRLVTPGLRLFRAPKPGRFDGQLEVMGQLGVSRASTAATDTKDLQHRAFSAHASAGYRLASAWTPRGVVQWDYASGDGDPADGRNGRFDPLFGARRFEFGPTGLYGAVARSNVQTPGVRLEVTPHRTLDGLAGYRAIWLASGRDAWTTAALRDPKGASGTFVGHQIEARARWQPLPKNLAFELGGAHLVRGDFAANAPGARSKPATYVYLQVTGAI